MNPKPTTGTLAVPVHERDHRWGSEAAALTLVQYGDYECPSSRRVYALVQELFEKEKPLRFVFRHFRRLDKVHPHAVQAAAGRRSGSGARGRFGRCTTGSSRARSVFEEADLLRHAERLGLDVQAFEEGLTSGTHRERIRQDKRSGVQSGLRTTMALFLNGELHEGERRVAMAVRAVREQHA